MKRIGAITFDLWNTLIKEVAPDIGCHRSELFSRELSSHGYSVPSITIAELVNAAWSINRLEWQSGQLFAADTATEWILGQLNVELDEPATSGLVGCLEYMMPASELQVSRHARETLRTIRDSGVKLGLISDTGFSPGQLLRVRLEELQLLEFFDGATFSDEIGSYKPDARLFRDALSYLGVRPEATMHVGDLFATDIVGATASSFRSCRTREWYDDRTGAFEAEIVIDHLPDVLILLEPSSGSTK